MEHLALKFHTYEFKKHKGKLLYEWLLEKAHSMGLHGGSAFRALAGFGKHGKLHEEQFLELASNVPVEIVFYLSKEEAKNFLEELDKENLAISYITFPITVDAI